MIRQLDGRDRQGWLSLEEVLDDRVTAAPTAEPPSPSESRRSGQALGNAQARAGGADDWRSARACTKPGLPADLMLNPTYMGRARAHCAQCPVWRPCLDEGLSEHEGIWGGLDRRQRGQLKALRRLARNASPSPAERASLARRVRSLLRAAMTPQRLAEATGLDLADVTALASTTPPRRRSASQGSDRSRRP